MRVYAHACQRTCCSGGPSETARFISAGSTIFIYIFFIAFALNTSLPVVPCAWLLPACMLHAGPAPAAAGAAGEAHGALWQRCAHYPICRGRCSSICIW